MPKAKKATAALGSQAPQPLGPVEPLVRERTRFSVGQMNFPKELREKLGGVPPVGTYKAIISFAALTGRRAGEIGPQVIDLVPVAN